MYICIYIRYIYVCKYIIYIYIIKHAVISQLVMVVAFAKEIFQILSSKKITWHQICCFSMMSLVISRLRFFKLAKIIQKQNSMKFLFIC